MVHIEIVDLLSIIITGHLRILQDRMFLFPSSCGLKCGLPKRAAVNNEAMETCNLSQIKAHKYILVLYSGVENQKR